MRMRYTRLAPATRRLPSAAMRGEPPSVRGGLLLSCRVRRSAKAKMPGAIKVEFRKNVILGRDVETRGHEIPEKLAVIERSLRDHKTIRPSSTLHHSMMA